MAKLDKGFDPIALLQSVGNFALLLLIITVGALVPLKLIEVVSGYPVFQELSDFAKEPSLGIKTRRNNP